MKPGQSTPWYVEVPPPPSLTHLVARIWEMRVAATAEKRVRILPNSCVDIVVYMSDTSHGEGPAEIVAPPQRSFVVGSTLRSFIVRSVGRRHIVGASLLPAGVQPLLGLPARLIGERIAALGDVIGSRAAEMEDTVSTTDGDHAVTRMGDALLRLRSSREVPALIGHAVHRVRTAGGRTRIDALANETNLSTRQLERLFLEHVGLTPKTYSRLVRFDRVARGIGARGSVSWSHFALTHGFNDQAHLINEFKAFAGVTPAQFEHELAAGVPSPEQQRQLTAS